MNVKISKPIQVSGIQPQRAIHQPNVKAISRKKQPNVKIRKGHKSSSVIEVLVNPELISARGVKASSRQNQNMFWIIQHTFRIQFSLLSQHKKIYIKLFLIFLAMTLMNSIVDGLKDTFVMTMSGGVKSTPALVLLQWGFSFIFLVVYSQARRRLSRQTVFNLVVFSFLGFYLLFGLFLFPNRQVLHGCLDSLAAWAYQNWWAGCHGIISVFQNWTYTLFYVFAELWGDVGLSLLFYTFANEVVHEILKEKALYIIPLFGFSANFAQILSGVMLTLFNQNQKGLLTLLVVLAVYVMFEHNRASKLMDQVSLQNLATRRVIEGQHLVRNLPQYKQYEQLQQSQQSQRKELHQEFSRLHEPLLTEWRSIQRKRNPSEFCKPSSQDGQKSDLYNGNDNDVAWGTENGDVEQQGNGMTQGGNNNQPSEISDQQEYRDQDSRVEVASLMDDASNGRRDDVAGEEVLAYQGSKKTNLKLSMLKLPFKELRGYTYGHVRRFLKTEIKQNNRQIKPSKVPLPPKLPQPQPSSTFSKPQNLAQPLKQVQSYPNGSHNGAYSLQNGSAKLCAAQTSPNKDPRAVVATQTAGKEQQNPAKQLNVFQLLWTLTNDRVMLSMTAIAFSQGIVSYFIDFHFKHHAREMFRTTAQYQSAYGKVQIVSGVFTFLMMIFSSVLFQQLKWKGVANLTPNLITAFGAVFFSLCFVYNLSNPLALPPYMLKVIVLSGACLWIVNRGSKFGLFKPAEELVYINLSMFQRQTGKAAIDVFGVQSGKMLASILTQVALILGGNKMSPVLGATLVVFIIVVILWKISVNKIWVALMRKQTVINQRKEREEVW